ncbi:MAG: DUF488 family protein [Terriglobales bacterium]
MPKSTIYTVGHSTRSAEEFVSLLRWHGVCQLADVRSIPRSRHNPQFAQPALTTTLAEAGIACRVLAQLGGLRHSHQDSPNTGWRNASFRGFADYMQTSEFAAGAGELEAWARLAPTAIMCAEAVPWRCHRSLIGDALEARGWQVLDIMGEKPASPHRTTPFLRVMEGRLTYPSP